MYKKQQKLKYKVRNEDYYIVEEIIDKQYFENEKCFKYLIKW